MSTLPSTVPVIGLSPFLHDGEDAATRAARREVAARLGEACRAHGFFYLRDHGLDPALLARMEALARAFFALPEADKQSVAMTRGGRAWRGWFRTGGELTSGRPDWKEGLYLGQELPADDARVRAGWPLHGANQWPRDDALPGFASTTLAYLDAVTAIGQRVLRAIALSLDLAEDYFAARYTADPLVLLRLFNYPSVAPAAAGGTDAAEAEGAAWGVGEHTDYGLLTLLYQDATGGLQIRGRDGWIDAPPIPGTLVCNIGDMLDLITGGLYRSTPHRVRLNRSGRDRLSIPLFLDPGFEARVERIAGLSAPDDDSDARWDRRNVHAFGGTYGEYLLAKVGQVFPDLGASVLP
ncbi:2-oxoglutarate and iron-dependent oxygenase domain-containing protein [Mitsuaria sp. GD03876]|uniref:isopenicillin N synthase family dioxygenase n=1 Tax=Mitsuaria sp. GD03876 TaxID=2975399 RepID=UPI00244C7378|nr:2-oxoglutarate and iron-dependent oxygenase domain-containing protein [Mitsuaria sp. GD03876]MDH0867857.1 isopenicillin N synthase family oxygenase [Mitsuaria sp. GD03876]